VVGNSSFPALDSIICPHAERNCATVAAIRARRRPSHVALTGRLPKQCRNIGNGNPRHASCGHCALNMQDCTLNMQGVPAKRQKRGCRLTAKASERSPKGALPPLGFVGSGKPAKTGVHEMKVSPASNALKNARIRSPFRRNVQ
jgi:hypothetical protein